MPKTYKEVRQQIEMLERQAEQLRQTELADVIAWAREAVASYGLTAADLGLRSGRGAPATKSRTASQATPRRTGKVAVKYRDDQGNTWTGRGLKPRWLSAALQAGKALQDFAV